MSKFAILFSVVGSLLLIGFVFYLLPQPAYILVVDQRGIDANTAGKVAQNMCDKYPLKEIYWVFNNNDPTSHLEAMQLTKPKECTVKLINSYGAAMDMAYAAFFGKYANQAKYLLFLPTADPTMWDIEIINRLPATGVTITELNLHGDETIIAR